MMYPNGLVITACIIYDSKTNIGQDFAYLKNK